MHFDMLLMYLQVFFQFLYLIYGRQVKLIEFVVDMQNHHDILDQYKQEIFDHVINN